jgi:hypothetical protein
MQDIADYGLELEPDDCVIGKKLVYEARKVGFSRFTHNLNPYKGEL